MKTVVFKFNLSEGPMNGTVVLVHPPVQKPARRSVHLRNEDGIPAEELYATACQEVGCDCALRLGKN